LIGFVSNQLLNFLYYKYDSSTNKNYLISTSKGLKFTFNSNSYNIKTKALSCQYMLNNSNKKIIVCFFCIYNNRYYIAFDYYTINSSNALVKYTGLSNKYFNFHEISCIKTSVTTENQKL